MSPSPIMRIVLGHNGHAYTSYADCLVVEDVPVEDVGFLTSHGYIEVPEALVLEHVEEVPQA
jgi:hypothetical protein